MKKKTKKNVAELLAMSFKLMFLFCFLSYPCIDLSAQNTTSKQFNVSYVNKPLTDILFDLEKKSKMTFAYKITEVEEYNNINYSKKNVDVETVLSDLLKKTSLGYTIDKNTILIHPVKKNIPTSKRHIVEGVVFDEANLPLIGASVYVKGSGVGTITDEKGGFSLEVDESADSLTCSFIGYKPLAFRLNPTQKYRKIKLQPAANEVEELIVIAYGTTEKKAYTGAVSSLNASQLENNKSNNVLSSLQGMVPGLMLQNKAGAGGTSKQDIVIRGASSINGNKSPLYIIDGVPSEGMEYLNPDDIQSISVLKDASAISLYGARATNGVILITTKKGKTGEQGRININYTGQVGCSFRSGSDFEKIDPADYYKLTWEALRNAAYYNERPNVVAGKYNSAEEYASNQLLKELMYNAYSSEMPVGIDGNIDPQANLLWWENYDDLLISKGLRTEHSVGVSGSSDRVNYYMSIGYLYQDGAEVLHNWFDRFSSRLNLDIKILKNLTAGVNMGLTTSRTNNQYINNSWSSSFDFARYTPGLYPMYKRTPDGSFFYNEDGEKELDFGDGPDDVLNSRRPNVITQGIGYNPFGTIGMDKNKTKSYYWIASYFLNYEIIKDLNLRAVYSTNIISRNSDVYKNKTFGSSAGKGSANSKQLWKNNWTLNAMLSYDKAWKNKNKIRAIIGAEVNEKSSKDLTVSSEMFLFDQLNETVNGSVWTKPLNGNLSTRDRLIGFFSRAEYDYLNRYFLSGSLRRDGSSNFHRDSRWGLFWSLGASWILSAEKFMKPITWIDFAKIRASYGTSGNLGVNNYRSYYGTNYSFLGSPSVYICGLANKDLRWETNKQFNIGLDLNLLQNRLQFTLDYYNRISDDLFYKVPLPSSVGYSGVVKNIGDLSNRGIEFTVNSENIRMKNFRWNTGFNIANNKNKIGKLNQDEFVVGSYIYKVGKSISEFYIPEWAGVNVENGLPMWYINEVDLNTGEVTNNRVPTFNYNELASKSVTLNDGTKKTYKNLGKYYAGNCMPVVIGGLSNQFFLHKFDLSFLFNFSLGGKAYSVDYLRMMGAPKSKIKAYHKDMLNRWQKPGDIAEIPRLSTEGKYTYTDENNKSVSVNNAFDSMSSFYLRSTNFLKLKTLNLGYTLDNERIKNKCVSSIRIFCQAENLFYLSKMKGFDPEQISGGMVSGEYPSLATYSIGVKINL